MASLADMFGSLNDDVSEGVAEFESRLIRLGDIKVRPQVRTEFDEEKIKALAESIRSCGLQEPLTVARNEEEEDEYYLINGERRYRALKLIHGEDFDNVSVNCIIDRRKSTFNDELALNQIVDNMVRENLSHYELAKAFKALNDNGMPYTKIASACGLSKSTVSNIVTLLDGSDTIKEIYPMVDDVVSLSSLIRKEKDYPDEVARFCEKVKEDGSATRKTVRSFISALTEDLEQEEYIPDVVPVEEKEAIRKEREEKESNEPKSKKKKVRIKDVLEISRESGTVQIELENGTKLWVYPNELTASIER